MPSHAPFVEVVEEGGIRKVLYRLHAGQRRAMESTKREVLVLAGWQSGKSVVGPPWMQREMQARGPGDYLVASPTYPLMLKKVLPDFLAHFDTRLRLGKFVGGKNIFTFSPEGCRRLFRSVPDTPTQVFFGHAGDPDSLESATAKAAWLDECGQKGFRLESQEAIKGRLSIHQGRILYTTRPFDLGWLKQKLWDPWERSGRNHPYIDIINFRSIDNPAFPREEYEKARAELPGWKFRQKYDGQFERPAGLIYDAFVREQHVVPRIPIPPTWPRYVGLDFGGVNTAGTFWAEEPGTKRLFAYREYKAGGRTAREHVKALLDGEPGLPAGVYGGAKSEDNWRAEFRAAGCPVREPATPEVEVGIDRVYGCFKRDELRIFEDLPHLLDELESYSRVVGDDGEPTEKIEAKETYHLLDSVRYILGSIRRQTGGGTIGIPKPGDREGRSVIESAPAGVFLNDSDSRGQW